MHEPRELVREERFDFASDRQFSRTVSFGLRVTKGSSSKGRHGREALVDGGQRRSPRNSLAPLLINESPERCRRGDEFFAKNAAARWTVLLDR